MTLNNNKEHIIRHYLDIFQRSKNQNRSRYLTLYRRSRSHIFKEIPYTDPEFNNLMSHTFTIQKKKFFSITIKQNDCSIRTNMLVSDIVICFLRQLDVREVLNRDGLKRKTVRTPIFSHKVTQKLNVNIKLMITLICRKTYTYSVK